jgi:hypothetical protein
MNPGVLRLCWRASILPVDHSHTFSREHQAGAEISRHVQGTDVFFRGRGFGTSLRRLKARRL